MSVQLEFMYNRTGKRRLGRIYSTVGEGKDLYSAIPKPGIFGLGIRHFDERVVPENVVMVAIDMCRKSPVMGEWIYGIA